MTNPPPKTLPQILIVTGSETLALRLRLMAESEGAQVAVANDLGAALREAANARPDAVMVDRSMDQWRGIGPLADNIPILMVDAARPDWEKLRDRLAAILAGDAPAESVLLANSLARARILLVDDSVTYREFLRHELEASGAEIQVRGTGAEGIDLLQAEHFDCVLLDLVLPGMDGLRLCAEVARIRREQRRQFLLIVLTSREGRADLLQSLEAGADSFLRKSQDTALLSAKLGAMLRRKFMLDRG